MTEFSMYFSSYITSTLAALSWVPSIVVCASAFAREPLYFLYTFCAASYWKLMVCRPENFTCICVAAGAGWLCR